MTVSESRTQRVFERSKRGCAAYSARRLAACAAREVISASILTLLARAQEGDQIGQLSRRQLLIQSRRHHRHLARLNLLDVLARDPYLLVRAGDEQDLVCRLRLHE